MSSRGRFRGAKPNWFKEEGELCISPTTEAIVTGVLGLIVERGSFDRGEVNAIGHRIRGMIVNTLGDVWDHGWLKRSDVGEGAVEDWKNLASFVKRIEDTPDVIHYGTSWRVVVRMVGEVEALKVIDHIGDQDG